VIGTLVALTLLLGSSAALGALLRRAVPLPDGPGVNALTLTAGLGATALLLALLALAGQFVFAPLLVGTLAIGGLAAFRRKIGALPAAARRALSPAHGAPNLLHSIGALAVAFAALSAIAPVTDPDSLAYPLPIARRLAETGAWRFWPDLWRSVFPLSQELLLALAVRLGADRLGAVSALELVLCAFLLESLARRAGLGAGARAAALLIGLGCPAVAFLAPSAKEDLLVCCMTLAAAHGLFSLDKRGGALSAGLFAGLAAGAKYSGLPLAAGVVLAVFVASPGGRARAASAAALAALAAAGLFYAVNLARHGNPLPPYLSPPLPSFLSPLSREAALTTFRWGAGREPLDLLLAPLRMLATPARFGTAGGLFNPLAWLGLLALATRELRRRFTLPLVVCAVVYAAWLATDQVARLLLPAALLLSLPAGEILSRAAATGRALRMAIGAALALSAASVLLVSGLRLGLYLEDRDGFLARATPAHADLEWMNAHLDASRHRVATTFKASEALRVPWMNLEPTYQAEIPAELLGTGRPLLLALEARGFTHVFLPSRSMPALERLLVPARENPASLLGGVHLLRPDPTIPTTLYALPRDNPGRESRGR
jgi:hypothetical protein